MDTNIIIFHVLKDSNFWKRSAEIIKNIDEGENVFIPLPVLKEILFELRRHNKGLSEIIEILMSFQRDNVKIAEDDFDTFIQGLQAAEKYKINPTDGVIVSLMNKYGITEIYSNDLDFDKVPGIKRIF